MLHTRLWPIALGLISILAASAPCTAASRSTLIRNVAVVDVENGELLPERDVLIRDKRIERVGRSGRIGAPDDAVVVNGAGLYLMPGLFDAHVHITAGQGTFEPLLIAHGVTAVRDTGAPTDIILQMREAAADGETLSPELIVTGAIVDGDPPIWPFSEACDTPEQARDAINRLADAGVDQIKVYSMLKPEVYAASVDEAKRRGLKVTGHVPLSVSLREAIKAGQDCIEHFDGLPQVMLELLPEQDADEARRGSLFATFRGWMQYDDVDRDALRGVLRELAEHEVMQCPTLSVFHGLVRAGDDEDGRNDERMKYVPVGLRAFWESPGYRSTAQLMPRILPAKSNLLREMHEHGVPLMIGTDLGNPFVFPGWSVHEEMSIFQDTGIPPKDVLRMATIVPARFCGVDDRLGTISAGKLASMVLVRKNPLDEVAHAAEIEAVFLRGQYFDRQALDGLFDRAAEQAASPTPAVDEIALHLPGRVVHQGRLVMKFQEWDAGSERFLITRDDDGWHVSAQIHPMGGGQMPSLTTLHLDHEGAFLRATWNQLTDPPTRAEYWIENDAFHGRATIGDGEPQSMTLELPESFMIAPPILAADMTLYPLKGLEPGDRQEVTMIGFGFVDWRLQRYPATIERRDDAAVAIDEGGEESTINAHVYHITMEIEMIGEMEAELRIDETGLLRSSTINMAFGTMTAEYHPE